jgi:formylglycine-generating enzyme required for sulfatase activity
MKNPKLFFLVMVLLALTASGCGPLSTEPTTKALTATPTEGSTPEGATVPHGVMTSEIDSMEMVYVSAGEFTMGAEASQGYQICVEKLGEGNCELDWFEDEEPVHIVTLDAFWIDKTEVTNVMYRLCVAVGVCAEPSNTRYYNDDDYADHPVVYVSWYDTNDYCSWADRRLPTEAEWEKAARGTSGRIYPWGDTFDGNRVNFCDQNCTYDWADSDYNDGYQLTAPVGSFPDGASPYGLLDMLGNVWEWTLSLYHDYPYDPLDGRNELDANGSRVLRGGSWHHHLLNVVRAAFRVGSAPDTTNGFIGFRCASSFP